MKKIILVYFIASIASHSFGQARIGIGTNTPLANLDVRGSLRVGGITSNSAYISYDSLTGQFKWNNASLLTTANQAIIQHSASAEGFFYNNPQLEYRYQDGTPRFFTNWQTGNGFVFGKLGIGHASPLSPLHMGANIGSKMIFFGEGNGYNYGIDVQPYRLQIHNNGAGVSNITFGYGTSTNFTENMRITSDGLVGIGTADPQAALDVRKMAGQPTLNLYGTQHVSHFNYGPNENTYLRGGKNNSKLILNDGNLGPVGIGVNPQLTDGILDVGGRMLIRSGGSLSNTAGFWLNKVDNSGQAAFIGMENDDYVGFFGNTTGWKFGMNTQTGALKINGSEGSPGKVLQSNGSSQGPSWVSSTNELYNNTIMVVSNIGINVDPHIEVDVPGLTYTFTPSGNVRFIVYYMLMAAVGFPCSVAPYSTTGFDVLLKGANGGTMYTQNAINNCGRQAQVSGIFEGTLTGGAARTLKIAVSHYDSPNIIFSCTCPWKNVMIIQFYYE